MRFIKTKNLNETKILIYKSLDSDKYFFLSSFFSKNKFEKSNLNNRKNCVLTKRFRGLYNDFALSRNQVRLFGNLGIIPGLKKSS